MARDYLKELAREHQAPPEVLWASLKQATALLVMVYATSSLTSAVVVTVLVLVTFVVIAYHERSLPDAPVVVDNGVDLNDFGDTSILPRPLNKKVSASATEDSA